MSICFFFFNAIHEGNFICMARPDLGPDQRRFRDEAEPICLRLCPASSPHGLTCLFPLDEASTSSYGFLSRSRTVHLYFLFFFFLPTHPQNCRADCRLNEHIPEFSPDERHCSDSTDEQIFN